MADDFRERRAAGDDERPPFGWPAGRRRPGDPAAAQPAAEGRERPADAPPAADQANRLRPSGQLQRSAPQGRSWGSGEAPPPPGIPGQARISALRQSQQAAAAAAAEAPARTTDRTQVEVAAGQKGNPQAEAAKIRLHELLIEELEHGALEGLAPDQQRDAVMKAARELLAQEGLSLGGASREELLEAVADEALGLGPLEPLLRDPTISEVMVND